MNEIICDECGQPCGLTSGDIVGASDEWGDQAVWGQGSDCCFATWHEADDQHCPKCASYIENEDNCAACGWRSDELRQSQQGAA